MDDLPYLNSSQKSLFNPVLRLLPRPRSVLLVAHVQDPGLHRVRSSFGIGGPGRRRSSTPTDLTSSVDPSQTSTPTPSVPTLIVLDPRKPPFNRKKLR